MPTPDDTHRAQIAGLRAQVRELVEALERVEPNIGWRGTPADDLDSDLFACEFCGGTAASANEIPHHDECLIHVVRAALARARDEATEGEDHG